MLLDDLVNVIETLQQRIRDHGDSLRQNETRTRAALIDPLLTALGWDVANPSLVTPEYRVDVGWADYALQGLGNKPSAIVEAKRLGAIVENHLEQAVNYCIQQGIAYAAVTDGSHWQLYRTFDPVPLAEKLVLDVRINSTQAHECALQLLLMWRPNVATGKAVPASAPTLSATILSPTTVEPSVNTQQTATPPEPPSGDGWTSLGDLPPGISWRSKPSLIRFPGGEERAIQWSQWKRVLVEVVEWLIREGALTGDKCPIGQVPQRYIINSEPVHPSGHPFFYPAQLSNALYLASAANAKRAASDCIFLMKLCNQDPASVHLKLG